MSPSQGDKSLVSGRCLPDTSCGISSRFQLLSPSSGQVAHVLLTRPPLSQILFRRISRESASFDLHVLGTPPAFVLSQDQTLNKFYLMTLSAVKPIHRSLLLALKEIKYRLSFRVRKEPFLVLICISFTLFNLQGAQGVSACPACRFSGRFQALVGGELD